MSWLAVVMMAMNLAACGTGAPHDAASGEYQTIPVADPRQNSVIAANRNAEAARLIDDGKITEAEAILKSALSSDVMHGPAHNNLGKVYYHQGKFYLAAREFQYAIHLMPNQPEPLNNLGLVFERVGRLNDAVEWYEKASELQADSPEYLGNLARARLRRGDGTEAVRPLLEQLLLKEVRPEWRSWAERKLKVS